MNMIGLPPSALPACIDWPDAFLRLTNVLRSIEEAAKPPRTPRAPSFVLLGIVDSSSSSTRSATAASLTASLTASLSDYVSTRRAWQTMHAVAVDRPWLCLRAQRRRRRQQRATTAAAAAAEEGRRGL